MTDKPDNPPEKFGKPGGVKHDSRGNAVWQWAANTGRQALDSTSALLRKLDVPGLKLEDDKPAFRADDPGESPPKAGGYNPYGTQARREPASGKPAIKPTAKSATRPATPAVPPRRSFWSRLFRRK